VDDLATFDNGGGGCIACIDDLFIEDEVVVDVDNDNDNDTIINVSQTRMNIRLLTSVVHTSGFHHTQTPPIRV